MNSKNPLVIYHANCADGFTAAWCFYDAQGRMQQTFDFHPGVYNDFPPDCTDRVVYLVDFSYKRDTIKLICKEATKVIIIDHHKTAIEDLSVLTSYLSGEFCANLELVTDLGRSGAMLAWDYLNNDVHYPEKTENYKAPPLLLAYVQDRDLWSFTLPFSREVNAAIFSYDYSFTVWDMLMQVENYGLSGIIDAGVAIIRKHDKDIKELLNVCLRHVGIGGVTVPVASLPYIYSSDAGHLMAKDWKEGREFAACYWDTSTHRIFSLRSANSGMDVSAIALPYGGGGHKNAAGFRVARDHTLARF